MGKDKLYETMKVIAKQRKMKASPQHDLYKKDGLYFYHAFYAFDFFHPYEEETGLATIILDISVKYCRFDELRWGILQPENDLKFTDRVRANSIAACKASFPRKKACFQYDGSENGLSQLCEDILDYLVNFYRDFWSVINRDYGTLEEYYIANIEENPLLAGLVYIERGQFQDAEKCFRLPNMSCKNSSTPISPVTEEQLARVSVSCKHPNFRSDYERLLDYTIAMQHGVKWTKETADYGLLPEERQGK